MILVFRGARGAVRAAWSDYALLRDYVSKNLARGGRTEGFSSLIHVERAVDRGFVLLNAVRLRTEAFAAYREFSKLSQGASPRSIAARATLGLWRRRPSAVSARVAANDRADKAVMEAVERFVGAVLTATEAAAERDQVLVAYETRVARAAIGSDCR